MNASIPINEHNGKLIDDNDLQYPNAPLLIDEQFGKSTDFNAG